MAQWHDYFPRPAGELLLFFHLPQGPDRLLVHQFLEREAPEFKKTSLGCEALPGCDWREFYVCYECDRLVPLVRYCRGSMANNQDESVRGTCEDCDQDYCYEPNFDFPNNHVLGMLSGNVLCWSSGRYFDGYKNRKHRGEAAVVSTDALNLVLANRKVYAVLAPKNGAQVLQLNKPKLGAYLSEQLKQNRFVAALPAALPQRALKFFA